MRTINCHIPTKLRITGRLNDAQLDQLGEELVCAIKERITFAEQTIALQHTDSLQRGRIDFVRDKYDPSRYDKVAGRYDLPSYDRLGDVFKTVYTTKNKGKERLHWRSITTPSSVADAIKYLKTAKLMAQEKQPDWYRMEKLVQSVEEWVNEVGSNRNIHKHFFRKGMNLTHAHTLVSNARAEVSSLCRNIRRRRKLRGLWNYYIKHLEAASPYLEILSGERAYGSSSVERSVEKYGKITGIIAITPIAVALGVAAVAWIGPLIIAEATLFAETSVVAGRTVWILAVSNPVEATVIAEFAAGTMLQIGASGGIGNYIEGLKTPEGVLQTAFEILVLRMQVYGGRGQAPRTLNVPVEVVSVKPNSIKVRVTKTPIQPEITKRPLTKPLEPETTTILPAGRVAPKTKIWSKTKVNEMIEMGHTMEMHGPKLRKQDLALRILEDSSIQSSSRWHDKNLANDVISDVLNKNASRIRNWLNDVRSGSHSRPLSLERVPVHRNIGEGYIKRLGKNPKKEFHKTGFPQEIAIEWVEDLQAVTIILKPDGQQGFHVVTAIPTEPKD